MEFCDPWFPGGGCIVVIGGGSMSMSVSMMMSRSMLPQGESAERAAGGVEAERRSRVGGEGG